MKVIWIVLIFWVVNDASAQSVPKGRVVRMEEEGEGMSSGTSAGIVSVSVPGPVSGKREKKEESGNLPEYIKRGDRSQIKSSDGVVYVPEKATLRSQKIVPGDILIAVIDQAIVASPSAPTPIRAMVVSEKGRGAYFLGEAVLEKELKRILFNFSKVRLRDSSIFNIKASGLSMSGVLGLTGEYHTQAGKFFIAELASAAAAGYLDSTIQRNQNAFGTYIQAPSVQNSTKTAGVTALSRTTERMAEEARNAPEYTEIEGKQTIQIIVQDDLIEI